MNSEDVNHVLKLFEEVVKNSGRIAGALEKLVELNEGSVTQLKRK